jgi:hypothetical protein
LFFCNRFSIRINVLWQDEPGSRHNHHWNGLSVILLGGYIETIYGEDGKVKRRIERRPLSIRYQRAEEWHRTDYLNDNTCAVTLYLAGKKRREGQWLKEAI